MSIWQQTTGKGMPLLLLHGWGMNATVWEPVLDQLNRQYEVTRLDLPGHGYSEVDDGSHTLAAWAQAVAAIAPDNAIWLGWSLGGLIALQAAVKQMKSMRALYLMTATPCFARRNEWQCAMPITTLDQFAENLDKDTQGTLLRFLSLQIKGCDDARGLLKKLRAGFSAHPNATDAALKAGLGFLRDEDIRSKLGEISIPMHWTFGERDTLVPACASEFIEQALPDATVQIIKGAGHVPFLSHSGECMESLDTLAGRTAT